MAVHSALLSQVVYNIPVWKYLQYFLHWAIEMNVHVLYPTSSPPVGESLLHWFMYKEAELNPLVEVSLVLHEITLWLQHNLCHMHWCFQGLNPRYTSVRTIVLGFGDKHSIMGIIKGLKRKLYCLCWKNCKYKEWASFFSWFMGNNQSMEQTNRLRTTL